jgi:hypothetical protein
MFKSFEGHEEIMCNEEETCKTGIHGNTQVVTDLQNSAINK